MKIQFKVIATRLGYKQEDIIKTWVFVEGNYTFLILNHNYGDAISLKMSDKMPVDFNRVNDVDNFILNNKRHIKFKPLDMSPSRELDIIYTPKEEYKNATVYCTPTANIFKITTTSDAMLFLNGFYYLVMEPTNKPGYYLTFADEYVVLTDREYNAKDDILPGITLAKLPLPKEKLKNVLTFDNPEDIDLFLYKIANIRICNKDLPEEYADVYIILRHILAYLEQQVASNNIFAINTTSLLLFEAKEYNDINEILSLRSRNTPETNTDICFGRPSLFEKGDDNK